MLWIWALFGRFIIIISLMKYTLFKGARWDITGTLEESEP